MRREMEKVVRIYLTNPVEKRIEMKMEKDGDGRWRRDMGKESEMEK